MIRGPQPPKTGRGNSAVSEDAAQKGKSKVKVKLRAITILFCSLASLFLLTSCSKISDPHNEFRVGMECAYSPFNWVQPDDSHGAVKISGSWYACGYDVEIAKIIADAMGRKLIIAHIDWDGLLPALTSGKIDAIIGGMSATPERKEAIDFTNNYYKSNIVVVVKKDGPYSSAKSLEDLAGARITGQLGTLHYDKFIDQISGVEKQPPMKDFASMIVAIGSGKIDGYVSERPGAMSAVATNSRLEYIEFEQDKGFTFTQDEVAIAIGVKKGNTKLKDQINEVLATISEETRTRLINEAVEHQPSAGLA